MLGKFYPIHGELDKCFMLYFLMFFTNSLIFLIIKQGENLYLLKQGFFIFRLLMMRDQKENAKGVRCVVKSPVESTNIAN